MHQFPKAQYRSYHNSGEGDCLFESFRQSLQLEDTVSHMRSEFSEMVKRLELASESSRVSQLNEHIMREIETGNVTYMGYGFGGGDGFDERNARLTLISSQFSELWAAYTEDMNDAAYAGNAEAITFASMYSVNLTIWAYNPRNDTASHITTILQSPPASKTVHLLNQNNFHFESTSLPNNCYPLISDPSPQQAVATRSNRVPQSGSDKCSLPIPANPGHNSIPSILVQADNTVPVQPLILNPDIHEYSGLVLNDLRFFKAILDGYKIFEVRTISRPNIRPRIVFHPNKRIRDGGYAQNIEAKIKCFQHEIPITNAVELLAATNNGAHLGLNEEQTVAFVQDAQTKNSKAVFYLYSLTEPRFSLIEWIDSKYCNQSLFSPHQYTTGGKTIILFQWPVNVAHLQADPRVL
jgi:hypothetical protein